MKNVSKRLVAAITAICLGSAIAPFTVGAVTYDPCDVNHDGDVDISDVIVVNQHLSGARYFRNYSQLDANRSHTVDAADANCVMRKVVKGDYSACYIRQYGNGYMQVVNMPAVSSANTLDNSAQTSDSRSYICYSYITKEKITYQLTTTFANLNDTPSTQERSIIGTDDRTVAHGYENTGIVRIGDSGTGFIVGDHEIATAAHCVCGKTMFSHDIRKGLTLTTYDRTGTKVSGSNLTIAEIHVPEVYFSTLAGSESDYALITVKEDLSDYAHFEIGNCYNMTSSEVGTIPIHVTGIPDDPVTGNSEEKKNDKLYTGYGSVVGSDNGTFLYYNIDTTGGQSGSPVYTITRERYNNQDHYVYTALAIHTKGVENNHLDSNYGTLMTRHQLQFFKNNSHASYQ